MGLLIRNGRVIDPANKVDAVCDIFADKGRILKVGDNISCFADKVIDASGKIVMPGLVDMHVHLREPGREDKETVLSGTLAAIKGGITSLVVMPNTLISIDSVQNVGLLKNIIKNTACASVFICAAITKSRLGQELTDIAELKKEGVVAISDDGSSVDNDEVMFKAFKKAKECKLAVICHSEDKSLSRGGVVNSGFTSTRLGLKGISRESEYTRVKRDILLAEKAGACVHIAHVSCEESVDIIAEAKKRKVKVTAETAPHYFSLSEEAVLDYDTNKKMNPPLRTDSDIEAIKKGLKDGIIDVIASDHAPHTENEKYVEFDLAEFGVIGLETQLGVSVTELIHKKELGWSALAQKLCLNPARILKIDKGTLGQGKDADIVIIDPDKEWVVCVRDFLSKSRNSAFLGMKLKGRVFCTIRGGEIVYHEQSGVPLPSGKQIKDNSGA